MRSEGASATKMTAEAGMTAVRRARRRPAIPSPREVARLLDAAPGLKFGAALSPAFADGHCAALVNATASLQIGRQDLPAPPQSRRNSIPRVSPPTKRTRSKVTNTARKTADRRLIPIVKTRRASEPEPARGVFPRGKTGWTCGQNFRNPNFVTLSMLHPPSILYARAILA